MTGPNDDERNQDFPWNGPVYGDPGTGPDSNTSGHHPQQRPKYDGPPHHQEYEQPRQQYPIPPQPTGPYYPQSYPLPYATSSPVDPVAPFGRHPFTGEPFSDKSKAAAGLLQILLPFVGICGVGRLYIGSTAIGLMQLLGFWIAVAFSLVLIGLPFLIGIWLWTVIDGVVIIAGNAHDGSGRVLRG